MSAIGCSVRVRRGRRPPMPGMVSVDAIDTSFRHDSRRSASTHMTPSAITSWRHRSQRAGWCPPAVSAHGIGDVHAERPIPDVRRLGLEASCHHAFQETMPSRKPSRRPRPVVGSNHDALTDLVSRQHDFQMIAVPAAAGSRRATCPIAPLSCAL